jgi:hypothetical protein
MAVLRYASLGVVLLLFGCASVNPKPIEVDMPGSKKHFIVMGSGDLHRLELPQRADTVA